MSESSTRARVVAALLLSGAVLLTGCGAPPVTPIPDAGEAPPTDDGGDPGTPDPLPPLEEGELLPGGALTSGDLGTAAFVQQAPNLSVLRRGAFENGLQFFRMFWADTPNTTDSAGLGPTFNATNCLGCHPGNGRGRVRLAPDDDGVGMLLRLGSEQGTPDPRYASQLQPRGIDGVPGEARALRFEEPVIYRLPDGSEVELVRPQYELQGLAYGPLAPETRVSPRLGQQLVGLGLLEAVREEDVLAWADPEDLDGDGISGRPAWLHVGGRTRLGRFGWKAAQPDVRWQAAAAFHGDIGITSPLFPEENCPPLQTACREVPPRAEPEINAERLQHVAAYLKLLGVPRRRDGESPTVRLGRVAFEAVGCADCHRPSYVTGEAEEPELQNQRIWPYTDLLLHDLGEGLSDGLREGDADGREWRTAPLWGLGLVQVVSGELRLLHDGRARSVEEAIRWHGGEADAARLAFEALPAAEREALQRFVLSL